MTREEEHFSKKEKKVGRTVVNKKSMAFHWLSPCWERRGDFRLPVGLCYPLGHKSYPFCSPHSTELRFLFINFLHISQAGLYICSSSYLESFLTKLTAESETIHI